MKTVERGSSILSIVNFKQSLRTTLKYITKTEIDWTPKNKN